MRLAADTNVLVRVLVRDDAEQTAQAEAVLRKADPLVLSIVVVCEVAWVLRRTYRFNAEEIRAGLTALTSPRGVEVDHGLVEAGLQVLAAGGDFADGCILEQARRDRCRALATFDKALQRVGEPLAQFPAHIA